MDKIFLSCLVLPCLALASGDKDYIAVQHPDGKIEIGKNVMKKNRRLQKPDSSSSPQTSTTSHAAPPISINDLNGRFEQYLQVTRSNNEAARHARQEGRTNFPVVPEMTFGQWRRLNEERRPALRPTIRAGARTVNE